MIEDNIDINWSCQDHNGNTILHHLILCCNKIEGSERILKMVLKNENIKNIINKKK